MLATPPLPSRFESIEYYPSLISSPNSGRSPRFDSSPLLPNSPASIRGNSPREGSPLTELELLPGEFTFLYDRDDMWYKNLEEDLRRYSRNDIKKAASALYEKYLPPPNKRTYTKDLRTIIKVVKRGDIFVPLVPALNYMSYFNDELGLLRWDKMSLQTLKALAIYHGYLTEEETETYTERQALLLYMVTTAIKVSLDQARYMGISRFKHYLLQEGFGQLEERDIYSLYDFYEVVYKTKTQNYAKTLHLPEIREREYRPLYMRTQEDVNETQNVINTQLQNGEFPLTKEEIQNDVIPFNSERYMIGEKGELKPIIKGKKAELKDLESYLSAESIPSPREVAELINSLSEEQLLKLLKFEVRDLSLDDIRQFIICWMIQPLTPYEKLFRKLLVTDYSTLQESIIDYPELFTPLVMQDKLSLIFALATFKLPIFNPLTPGTNEYSARVGLSQKQLSDVVKACYDYDGINTYFRFLIAHEVSTVEPFIYQFSEGADPIKLTKDFMIIPENMNPRKYFMDNIAEYENVFRRTGKPSLPTGKQWADMRTATLSLSIFTDPELVEVFGIGYTWDSRADLIRQLALAATQTQEIWSFANNPDLCVNKYSILELKDKDFNDPNDPIISYGRLTAYRSYQLSELVTAFQPREFAQINTPDEGEISLSPKRAQNGQIMFLNPGYNEISEQYQDTLRIFPLESMNQLLSLLRRTNNPQFDELISLIDGGLKAQAQLNKYLSNLRDTLFSLSLEEKDTFRDFCYKLFFLSMYARYWKGDTFQYPYIWVEDGSDNPAFQLQYYASVEERSQNYIKSSEDLSLLLTSSSFNVISLINNIFILDYDWISGFVRPTNTLFSDLFKYSLQDNRCVEELADRGVMTAYVLITRILNEEVNTKPEFIPILMGLTLHRNLK